MDTTPILVVIVLLLLLMLLPLPGTALRRRWGAFPNWAGTAIFVILILVLVARMV